MVGSVLIAFIGYLIYLRHYSLCVLNINIIPSPFSLPFVYLDQGLATFYMPWAGTTWLQSKVGWVTSTVHQWQSGVGWGCFPWAHDSQEAGSCAHVATTSSSPAPSPKSSVVAQLSAHGVVFWNQVTVNYTCTAPFPSLMLLNVLQTQLKAARPQHNCPPVGSCAQAAAGV